MKHTRIIVTHYGGPDALRVVEEDCPEPKDGEVRVKVLGKGGVTGKIVLVRNGLSLAAPLILKAGLTPRSGP